MPTANQIRRWNIEANEAAQLERYRAAESFQPTRPPPPIPKIPDDPQVEEEISRFSDSDDDRTLKRALSFTRGASKRYAKQPAASLNCVKEMPSTELLDQLAKDSKIDQSNRILLRSGSAAAATALAAAEKEKPQPFPQHRQSSWESDEVTLPVSKKKYEDLKRRGLVPVWRLMDENRGRSRQGSFLKAGTLRKAKDLKKKPQRSNTIADPELMRPRRGGTQFF